MENEKIYIGKNYRLIIEQTIGSKIFDKIREDYEVKELRRGDGIVYLIEEGPDEEGPNEERPKEPLDTTARTYTARVNEL